MRFVESKRFYQDGRGNNLFGLWTAQDGRKLQIKRGWFGRVLARIGTSDMRHSSRWISLKPSIGAEGEPCLEGELSYSTLGATLELHFRVFEVEPGHATLTGSRIAVEGDSAGEVRLIPFIYPGLAYSADEDCWLPHLEPLVPFIHKSSIQNREQFTSWIDEAP